MSLYVMYITALHTLLHDFKIQSAPVNRYEAAGRYENSHILVSI